MHGWIILDKPSGISSAYAVGRVKKLLRPEKIGHAGTLDPLASGVLPLALGEATKTVSYMVDAGKSYSFTVTWGEERDTDDIEGKVTQISPERPSRSDIETILPRFIGRIQQTPPNYSAIKVDGKRAYEMAREGELLELKPRTIEVHRLEIAEYTSQTTTFACDCGKGTYIRSLARDMGRLLGCFGYVSILRRTQVGKFTENRAISLENLEKIVHNGGLGFLEPVESALDDILAQDIDESQAAQLKRGQAVILPLRKPSEAAGMVLARHNGRPVAICELSGASMRPVRVFNL